MILKKRISKVLTIASIISLFPFTSFADNDITIDQSFTYEQDGYWKPGRIKSKEFYINNNKSRDIRIDRLHISLKSSEYWKTEEPLDINSQKFKELAKYSKVTLTHNKNVLFEDKLENILSEDGIKLNKEIYIRAYSKQLLNMTIDMDLEMNNDAQALNNIFEIGLSYKMDTTNPPITPDPPPVDPELPEPPTVEPELPDPPVVDPELPDPPIVNPEPPVVNPDNEEKLPQTGGIINGASLIALGTVTLGAGILLNKKSDEEEGGKHDE